MNPFKAIGMMLMSLVPHKTNVPAKQWEPPVFDAAKAATPVDCSKDKIVTDGVRAKLQTMDIKLNKTFSDAKIFHDERDESADNVRKAITEMLKKNKRNTPPGGVPVHNPS